MKFTYLIGNGFDLNIGLKTSFTDFFNIYCNKSDYENAAIEKFKAEIRNNSFMWSDFEFQMGRYAHEVEPLGTLSIQDYFNCMENFRNEMITYLLKEEERINKFAFKNKCDTVCHRAIEYPFQYMRPGQRILLQDYLSKYNTESIEYNFIIFNYTHTFDEFLTPLGYNVAGDDNDIGHWTDDEEDSMIIDKIGEVIHVHGEFGNAILLGVNDEQQVNNPNLIKNDEFRWNYIKPIANEMLGEQHDEISKRVIEESDIIFIYGMSIGQTDKIWWQAIIKWLCDKTDSREHFLVVFSHNTKLRRNNPLDNIKNQKEIENKLLSFAPDSIKIDKNNITKHILCSLNSDIFKLDFDPFSSEY
ncbi:MAG: hypothetical protein HDT21_10280 [Ruminococcus sp.]|nr:hypothetical protein [Ruminococcus sp.]